MYVWNDKKIENKHRTEIDLYNINNLKETQKNSLQVLGIEFDNQAIKTTSEASDERILFSNRTLKKTSKNLPIVLADKNIKKIKIKGKQNNDSPFEKIIEVDEKGFLTENWPENVVLSEVNYAVDAVSLYRPFKNWHLSFEPFKETDNTLKPIKIEDFYDNEYYYIPNYAVNNCAIYGGKRKNENNKDNNSYTLSNGLKKENWNYQNIEQCFYSDWGCNFEYIKKTGELKDHKHSKTYLLPPGAELFIRLKYSIANTLLTSKEEQVEVMIGDIKIHKDIQVGTVEAEQVCIDLKVLEDRTIKTIGHIFEYGKDFQTDLRSPVAYFNSSFFSVVNKTSIKPTKPFSKMEFVEKKEQGNPNINYPFFARAAVRFNLPSEDRCILDLKFPGFSNYDKGGLFSLTEKVSFDASGSCSYWTNSSVDYPFIGFYRQTYHITGGTGYYSYEGVEKCDIPILESTYNVNQKSVSFSSCFYIPAKGTGSYTKSLVNVKEGTFSIYNLFGAMSPKVELYIQTAEKILDSNKIMFWKGHDCYITSFFDEEKEFIISSSDYFGHNIEIKKRVKPRQSCIFYSEPSEYGIRLCNRQDSIWTYRVDGKVFTHTLENPYYLEPYGDTVEQEDEFSVCFWTSELMRKYLEDGFNMYIKEKNYNNWHEPSCTNISGDLSVSLRGISSNSTIEVCFRNQQKRKLESFLTAGKATFQYKIDEHYNSQQIIEK